MVREQWHKMWSTSWPGGWHLTAITVEKGRVSELWERDSEDPAYSKELKGDATYAGDYNNKRKDGTGESSNASKKPKRGPCEISDDRQKLEATGK